MSKENDNNWKDRYLANLERLDEQERKLADAEALLRHGIARLCLVAQGGHPDLNRRLDALRKAVRGKHDPAAVRSMVDEISEAARDMDATAVVPDRKAESTNPFELARSLLEQLSAKLLTAAASEVRHNYSDRLRSSTADDELRLLAGELIRLIGPEQEKSGLEMTPKADQQAPPAHTMLLDLLSSLALPAELEMRRNALREQLSGEVPAVQWPQILAAIAALIADMRARVEAEKAGLESFLLQLTDRLQELDAHLLGAEQARQQSSRGSQELDRGVQAEVSSMETSIRQATSLDQLKAVVQDRLVHIRQRVDEHRHSEERRQVEMKEKLRRATERLQTVEQETARLRSDLQKRKIQAMSDPLTGIPNRLAFEEGLAGEYGRWKRYHRPLTLLILDIDHFKQINDSFGHKAGDKALQLIARVLGQQLRETDLLARYGGEEFVVLLPDTAQEHVAGVVEKLRGAVENCDFHHRGQRVPITLSCGYATFHEDDRPERVFQRADGALYRAKAEGRNRAVSGDSR